MANNSETGHAKNVANFDVLLSMVNGFGALYNPSKLALKPGALAALQAKANDVMDQLNLIHGQYSVAVASRNIAFEPLNKLTTRVLNALRASDVTPQIVDVAQSYVRKIQGKRATPTKTDEEKAALQAEGITVKEVSSSQMSFDNRLDNFDKLVQFLGSLPQYIPNEEELKYDGLTNLQSTLKTTNKLAVEATIKLSNARLLRDELLYKTDTGMVDTALSVKIYAKSLFGATSPQYRQLAGLTFKEVKQ